MTYSFQQVVWIDLPTFFSLLGFSSRSFLVGSSCESKLDRKNDFKESYCVNESQRVPLHRSKHLPRLKNLEETWLITFLASLLLKFKNSLSWFFRLALLRKWSYLSITKSLTFTENPLAPFSTNKYAKWQGKLISKIFWSPCALRISWRKLFRFPIIEFVLSEEYATKLSQSKENASLTLFHKSYVWCAVEPLLIFGISSNDAAISPESLSTCLTKTSKNLSSLLLFSY